MDNKGNKEEFNRSDHITDIELEQLKTCLKCNIPKKNLYFYVFPNDRFKFYEFPSKYCDSCRKKYRQERSRKNWINFINGK